VSALAVLLLRSTDEPERAVAALEAAAAAARAPRDGKPAVLLLEDEGARLGAKGVAETITGGGRPDAKAILSAILVAGGRVLVSEAAWRARGFEAGTLVDGATLVGPEALATLAADGYAIASF